MRRLGRQATGRSLVGLCLALFLGAGPEAAADDGMPVDLELMLAVDASGSVDDREFALQMAGIAAAFRAPSVIAAVERGPLGRIAVSVALWAEANRPKQALPWQLVDGEAAALRFAAAVAVAPRSIPAGGTGIGKAVWFSLIQIRDNGFTAPRRVIDLSGDGRETAFREFSVSVQQARAAADSFGVTVNGLAILNEEPELERYFRRRVITGPGAFALSVDDYEGFAEAMRRKLIREISYEPEIGRLGPADVYTDLYQAALIGTDSSAVIASRQSRRGNPGQAMER